MYKMSLRTLNIETNSHKMYLDSVFKMKYQQISHTVRNSNF